MKRNHIHIAQEIAGKNVVSGMYLGFSTFGFGFSSSTRHADVISNLDLH